MAQSPPTPDPPPPPPPHFFCEQAPSPPPRESRRLAAALNIYPMSCPPLKAAPASAASGSINVATIKAIPEKRAASFKRIPVQVAAPFPKVGTAVQEKSGARWPNYGVDAQAHAAAAVPFASDGDRKDGGRGERSVRLGEDIGKLLGDVEDAAAIARAAATRSQSEAATAQELLETVGREMAVLKAVVREFAKKEECREDMMNIIGGLQEAQFRAAQENKELWLQLNEKKTFDDHTSELQMQLQEEIVELRTMVMQSNEENAALRAAVAKLQHEDGLLKWV